MSTVLVFSDLHIPFEHKNYLDFVRLIRKNYKPDLVVCCGDLIDLHALSKYEHNPDGMSSGMELTEAKKVIKEWFKAFPNVFCCIGNHDIRLLKKAMTQGIPSAMLKSFGEFLEAPEGWKWSTDFEIDGVKYVHGDGYTGKMAHFNVAERSRQSIVCGHNHSFAGISYSNSGKDMIFGMNVGCGIDYDKYAFNYARNTPYKPVLSCGIVRNGKNPQIITMP